MVSHLESCDLCLASAWRCRTCRLRFGAKQSRDNSKSFSWQLSQEQSSFSLGLVRRAVLSCPCSVVAMSRRFTFAQYRQQHAHVNSKMRLLLKQCAKSPSTAEYMFFGIRVVSVCLVVSCLGIFKKTRLVGRSLFCINSSNFHVIFKYRPFFFKKKKNQLVVLIETTSPSNADDNARVSEQPRFRHFPSITTCIGRHHVVTRFNFFRHFQGWRDDTCHNSPCSTQLPACVDAYSLHPKAAHFHCTLDVAAQMVQTVASILHTSCMLHRTCLGMFSRH